MRSGHLNHTLFWENLAPKGSGGGEPPSGNLADAINSTYGSLENLKKRMNVTLAGIQGSGWGWLVKDKDTGALQVIAMPVSAHIFLNIPPTSGGMDERRPLTNCVESRPRGGQVRSVVGD